MIQDKAISLLLILVFLCNFSDAKPTTDFPVSLETFKINTTHTQDGLANSCTYTVVITTSCSSPRRTRDQISLAFGDAYGNQVYAPRLDDPRSGTFESCSSDTFQINGPCTYQVCYLYLYRAGHDGWKPEYVTVSGYYTSPATFYYNTFIPYGTWYGFNYCTGVSNS